MIRKPQIDDYQRPNGRVDWDAYRVALDTYYAKAYGL